jgi:hypothetical protein
MQNAIRKKDPQVVYLLITTCIKIGIVTKQNRTFPYKLLQPYDMTAVGIDVQTQSLWQCTAYF